MKKISFLICMLFAVHASQAQSIVGAWQGFLGVPGRQIRFVMHIDKTGNEYRSSFDSPDQNSFGLQGSKITPHAPFKGLHKNAMVTDGSPTVFVEGLPVARVGSGNNCGHHMAQGSPDVFVP